MHLRLGALYNLAGRKDQAALEYNEFLKKRPDHPDAQKLRDYIIANKPKRIPIRVPVPIRNPENFHEPRDNRAPGRDPDRRLRSRAVENSVVVLQGDSIVAVGSRGRVRVPRGRVS